MVGISDHPGGSRRSAKSSTLVTASASGFLILSGMLSFVPDAPVLGEAWHLRGPIAVLSPPQEPVPASVSGLHEARKPV